MTTHRATLLCCLVPTLTLLLGCDGETLPEDEASLQPIVFVVGSHEVGAAELDAAFELTERADAVFVGEVVEIQHQVSQPDAEGLQLPFTLVTWQIEDGIKGVASGARYTTRFIGGPIGELEVEVSEVPEFELGDRDLLFVERNGEVGCPLVGGADGRVQLGFGTTLDGVSRVAPSQAWTSSLVAGIRGAGLAGGTHEQPDLHAPFVFEMPRVATREELEQVEARHLEREAELAEPSDDTEQLALTANDLNPVLPR